MAHNYPSFKGLHSDSTRYLDVVFAELDKGLRSAKFGEQCGAIMRYPQFFDNCPSEIMIKASFVKLANVFRYGTNFVRLCVFQATQQSGQHLGKIGNVGNIVRSIHRVIHSNDPTARALTLKMFGSMACVISEEKLVHQTILSSLDSHDQVEVNAALFAASLFAKKSKNFSGSVCTKLTELIERLSVPLEIKHKFIFVCRNMNCDSETLEQVRALCLSVLKRYPSCRFVLSVLHTMTLLSKRSLVHLGDQVELLLKYLQEDLRIAVKKSVLSDLKQLASHSPHVWKSNHVHIILEFLRETSNEELLLLSLEVLSRLSSTIAVYLLTENLDISCQESPMLDCCQHAFLHDDARISIQGIKLYVHVVNYAIGILSGLLADEDEEKPVILEDLCSFMELKMILATNDQLSDALLVLKECLVYTLKLCAVCPSVVNQFSQHVVFLLLKCSKDPQKSSAMCEFLSALHSKFDEFSTIESSLKSLLVQTMDSFQSIGEAEETLILSIVRLLLQVRNKTNFSFICEDAEEEQKVDSLIIDFMHKVTPWTSFKVARQAARFGSHKLASEIFSGLTKLSRNEYHCFWLEGLTNYCAGEALLQVPLVKANSRSIRVNNILKANEFIESSFAAFKAATTCTNWFTFQTEYISLRSKTLRCLLQIIHACTSHQTIPPTAISPILVEFTGLEFHKVHHMIEQLKNGRQMASDLEKAYNSLYYKCFDADAQTLEHISLLSDVCKLIIQVLDSFFSITERVEVKTPALPETKGLLKREDVGHRNREWRQWLTLKKEILKVLKDMNSLKHGLSTVDIKNIKFIEEVATLCSKMPVCLPRFFFQKLQSTDIKLAVSPAMKSPDDPILVKCDCMVVVKVEGIVNRTGRKMCMQRTANKIQLSLRSVLATNRPVHTKVLNDFVEACPLQADYFCHKFLLSFSLYGIHQVKIEAGILDSSGNIWSTGTKSSLLFDAYDKAL